MVPVYCCINIRVHRKLLFNLLQTGKNIIKKIPTPQKIYVPKF